MDKEIIERRLNYMKEKLIDLKYDLEKYDKQVDKKDKNTSYGAIQRWAEEIVECAVNINIELLSTKNKITHSYAESFLELKCLNLFDEEFLKKITKTAGFRNRLAHDYMNNDIEITITSAKLILKLYKDYILKIQKFLVESDKK